MTALIIIAAILFAATLIVCITLPRRKADENSENQFINEDGLHIYYDRRIIRRNDGDQ